MTLRQTDLSPVDVTVENIGGITEASVGFSPGVTVLSGRNATNRTSYLRALMAALGSEDATVKGDAESGTVELATAGEVYSRTLVQRGDTTVFDGDPYLSDPQLADLYAFLLESNPARQAAERNEALYDVIMRPVDTDEIDDQLDRLESEWERIDSELAELASLEARFPEIEAERTQLVEDIESKRADLEAKRAERDELEGADDTPSELEDRLEQLRQARNDLEDTGNAIEDERRILEALRDEKVEVEAELDGLAAVDEDELSELEAIIRQHHGSIQSIESTLADLQAVIQFNESFVEGDAPEFVGSIREEVDADTEGSVTDKLVEESSQVVCWTCGSRIERAAIERTVDLLRDVHSEKIYRRNELREEIDELEAERTHIERTRDEHRRLVGRLEEIETEIEERSAGVDELEAEADELEAAVDELEAEIDDLVTDDHDELLAHHRAVNEAEFDLGRLEDRLEDVEAEIDSIKSQLKAQEDLTARQAEIDEEIEALRSRIERLEREAVEQFNEQMEAILELLEYENVERIWIEHIETEVKAGRRKEQRPEFDLHVVRTTDTGSVYEDTIDHLSESEREVVGLVFALSGYLAHEVYDRLPFMLLDSLEAFDSDRIAALVDHFSQYADYLVVALLPEDAEALSDGYERIAEI